LAGWIVVIVDMSLVTVVLVLFPGIVLVAMEQRRVVVFMAVVVRSVVERAERSTGVMVGDVIVVV